MKYLVAALLACALPAFGQGVPWQLTTQLHETCVAHAQETLHGRWRLAPEMSFDTPKFCDCADRAIQSDQYFGRLARMPESERGPSSWAAHTLADLYLMDGITCYSTTVGWPPGASPNLPARSPEEVRVVLGTRKGALYAAYNEALKRNPKLAGKVVLEFTIAPSGGVEDVGVRSSDLSDAAFLDAIKSIAGKMQFPAEPVEKLVTTYPLDFLPS